VVDITAVGASSPTHGRQIFLPRGGPLSFTFELNKKTNMPDPQKTLTDLLAAYRSGGHRNWLLLYDPTFQYYVLNLF
jgi:hypothetical protein